jgi:hypothetical protein
MQTRGGLHTGLNESRGLHNGHASKAAVGVTIVQPKQRHRLNVATGTVDQDAAVCPNVARHTLPE